MPYLEVIVEPDGVNLGKGRVDDEVALVAVV